MNPDLPSRPKLVVVSKRKRERDIDAGSDKGTHNPPPPLKNATTSQSQSQSQHQHQPSSQVPFHTIPSRIEDLINVIAIGGCPRCGFTECTKKGKSNVSEKSDKEHQNRNQRVIQRYCCRKCKKIFYGTGDNNNNNSNSNSNNSANSNNKPKSYVDRTFEGKQRIQSLFCRAYGDIVKKEMEADEVAFESRMQGLQAQLGEERRRVSKLLGIHLEEDRCINNESPVEESQSQLAKIMHNRSKKDTTGNVKEEKHPLRAMILLLREETRKLEQSSAQSLVTHRERSQSLGSGASPPIVVDVQVQGGLTTTQGIVEEGNVDVVSSTVDVVTVHAESDDNDGGYQLACTVKQEDGEEIEIFEKNTEDED